MEGAFEAIMKWLDVNGYLPLPGMRDIYLNSPHEVPPEELLTEVLWPVRKK